MHDAAGILKSRNPLPSSAKISPGGHYKQGVKSALDVKSQINSPLPRPESFHPLPNKNVAIRSCVSISPRKTRGIGPAKRKITSKSMAGRGKEGEKNG